MEVAVQGSGTDTVSVSFSRAAPAMVTVSGSGSTIVCAATLESVGVTVFMSPVVGSNVSLSIVVSR